MRPALWILLACLPVPATTAATAGRSEHFHVVSPLGPEEVALAAQALEAARERYLGLGFTQREPQPTTVVLLPTVVEMAPYLDAAAGRSRGLSLVGPDRNFILLAWQAAGDPLIALAHEYAHLVDPDPARPLWFREGLADYLSFLTPSPEGGLEPANPAERLVRLRSAPWLPLPELLAADRNAAAFLDPVYYAQSWLAVRWLALGEPDPRKLEPAPVAEDDLRALLETLTIREPAPPLSPALVEIEPIDDLQVEYWLADFERPVRPERARERLERLAELRPHWAAPQASLGALAMDAGRFDEAEERLEMAVRAPDATARTHHRYALLLLRPAEREQGLRAEKAAVHAELALEIQPANPRFLLTLGQARMVAGQWGPAAAAFRELLRFDAWRSQATEEFAELERRRTQAMWRTPAPRMVAGAPAPPPAALLPPLPANVPTPPRPRPQRPTWPPPGAEIIAGRIAYVDCSGPDKIISMRNPLFPMRFREPRNRPAHIFFPPDKDWRDGIPCGAEGWTINLAYRPYRDQSEIWGDVVAILF